MAVPTPPPAIAVRTDPCGGPQELLKKYLAASPCVFVRGQGSVQLTYAGTNTTGRATTASPSGTAAFDLYAHAYSYPGVLVNLGIAGNAQLTLLLPSYSHAAPPGSPPASGVSNVELTYKNLSYVDSVNGILAGISASYEAPSGTEGIAAPGPIYEVNPLVNFAVNKARNLGVSLAFPVTRFGPANVTFAPQAVPYWRSPGGTLLALVVRHDFSASVTSLTLNSAQLLSRQFQLQGTYGGNAASIDFANPIEGIARASATAYPRTFTLGFSYMLGRSEMPAPQR